MSAVPDRSRPRAPGGRLLPAQGIALLGALVLQALVHRGAVGLPGFGLLVAAGLLVGAGTLGAARADGLAFLGRAALLAGLCAALVTSLPGSAAEPVWPQILVLLVAARLQAEVAARRFRRFWRDPSARGGGARTQSLGAALCLGMAATLLFHAAITPLAASVGSDASPGPVDIVLRALMAETFVHQAIVLLFFVLLAALLDAWLLLRLDRRALSLMRARVSAAGSRLPRTDIAALAAACPGDPSETRTLAYVRDRCGLAGDARQSLDGLHTASRRLVRALIAFLPLLGFVGTVIGLAVAIGALGTAGPQGAADIGSSLAGLSIQFETTLLGLGTGLVASLLLALLERQEAELRHACERLVDGTASDDRP